MPWSPWQAALCLLGGAWYRCPSPRRRLNASDEVLAQDFFTEGGGRLLAFDGTREARLSGAADVLRLALERGSDRPVAAHAAIALAMPLRRAGKVLRAAERWKA